MSTAVSVFDWLRTREFKKAMDVKGEQEESGKKGDDRSALETYRFRLCVPEHSDRDSRGRPALHPIWPAAVVTEISSTRTARHKLQAARMDALIGSREKRKAIRTEYARFFTSLANTTFVHFFFVLNSEGLIRRDRAKTTWVYGASYISDYKFIEKYIQLMSLKIWYVFSFRYFN